MRPELQIVLDSLEQMERDQLPQLLGELETIRATALLKMSAPSPLPQRDELLTIESAARKLAQYESRRQVPATISAISDALRWAERIMEEIDRRWPESRAPESRLGNERSNSRYSGDR